MVKIVRVEKVLSSTGIIKEAYVPNGNLRIKGIEAKYMDNKGYNAHKSEERRKEILENIANIRKEMRSIAISRQHRDTDTIATPVPHKVKEALYTLNNIDKYITVLLGDKEKVQLHNIRKYQN